MSGQPAKRQKTTPRLGRFEHIPPEVLEIMLGSLDVRTLCTARLVCRPFSQAASRSLHSLRLSADDISSHPDTILASFPDVRQLTVSGVRENSLRLLEHPNLSAAITNVSMTCELPDIVVALGRMPTEQEGRLPPLPPLPSLTSLTVLQYSLEPSCVLPTTLRELVFSRPVRSPTPQPLLGLTQLTSLQIAILHDRNRPFDGLTTLRRIQRLEIKSRWSFIPTLAKFPHLTYLDWTPHLDMFEQYNEGQPPSLGTLTSLQKLVHLRIGHCYRGLARQDLATLGQLTSLRSLDLVSISGLLGRGNEAVPDFHLTRLGVNCYYMSTLMRRVEMEELQDLTVADLSGEWLPYLAEATGLTQLRFAPFDGRPCKMPWFPTFEGMTRLQALTIQPIHFRDAICADVVEELPGLTRLTWDGGYITNDDVLACAALRRLRNLHLLPTKRAPGGKIKPDVFMALAKRPQLSMLELSERMGITTDFLTDRVKAELNSRRRRMGWPPLAITLKNKP